MSRESRQRLRAEAKRNQEPLMRRKKFRWMLTLAIILIAAAVPVWIYFHSKPKQTVATAHNRAQPQTLKELLALSPTELEKCDIGLMNLLCADSLSGSENLGVQDCLKRLDGLAEKVKFDTDRHFYRFREHPEQFRNSLGYYRMMMLEQVLAQDLGIEYKPDLVEYLTEGKAPTYGVFNSDSKNVFIHGLLNGNHYGTCASMPVLLVAVAHRLGYPVNLAGAKLHIYARYEDYNGKHFNIETTVTEGFLTPDDNDYKTGQFAATEEEIRDYGWLRPMTHAEILNQFLDHRAVCLGMAKRYQEATEIISKSENYMPDTPLNRKYFQRVLEDLRNAPLGDKIDDWRQQIQSWEIPNGARTVYFENRKIQMRYFVGLCPDAAASQRAVDDLKAELVEYACQMTLTNPAPEFLNPGQHILDLADKAGHELRLPVVTLPPPLNNGVTPQDYFNCLRGMSFDNGGAVMDALWQHYQDVTKDWSNQPALLLTHWQEMGTSFPISPLTAH